MSIDSSALSAEAQQVFQAAMRLPNDQREKLADQLYLTIEYTADAEADKAWEATIARRVAEIENGTAKLLDWDELQQMMQDARHGAK
jgi:hypothetical protein